MLFRSMIASSSAVPSDSGLPEENFISRPPLFTRTNYDYWKNRMKNFIQAVDIKCWKIILRGPAIPTKKDTESKEIPIPESEYSEAHWKLVQQNAKALNMLYCALDVNEYNRISTCTLAK